MRRKPLSARVRSFSPARLRISELEDSNRDALALGLVAVGLLLAFVFYFDWEGGKVGEALATALRFLLGAAAYVIPVALICSRAGRDRHTETVHAGTSSSAGRSSWIPGTGIRRRLARARPGCRSANDLFNPDFFMDRGGLVGALEYWAISSLSRAPGRISLSSWAFPPACCWPPEPLLRASCPPCGDSPAGVEPAPVGSGTPSPASGSSPSEDALGFPLEEPEVEFRGGGARAARPACARGRGGADSGARPAGAEPELDPIAEDPLEQVEREVAATEGAALTPQGLKRSSITESEEISYSLPDPSILRRSPGGTGPDTSNQDAVAKHLVETLGHFGIEAQLVGRVAGPRVTRHELRLAPGTKVSKVTQLKDDLAYALASTDIRILAPIPGKQAVGVEVPNKRHRMVYLGDIFERELARATARRGRPRRAARRLAR